MGRKDAHTNRKSSDSFELDIRNNRDLSENNYSIKENTDFFGWLEGKVNLPLFGCGIRFHVKGDDSVYALRCAEFIEKITPENLRGHTALYKCFEALAEYVAELIADNDFDLGDVVFDEDSSVDDLIKILEPTALTFERDTYLSEEDCPVAFSLKLCLAPVPDEVMEIALHGDVPVYVGEFRGVSPWNEKLLKKKWNYARDL